MTQSFHPQESVKRLQRQPEEIHLQLERVTRELRLPLKLLRLHYSEVYFSVHLIPKVVVKNMFRYNLKSQFKHFKTHLDPRGACGLNQRLKHKEHEG
jgi:hypothetical protein